MFLSNDFEVNIHNSFSISDTRVDNVQFSRGDYTKQTDVSFRKTKMKEANRQIARLCMSTNRGH